MNRFPLSVREHDDSYCIVVNLGKPNERVVASRIPEVYLAQHFMAAPRLIDAAMFAANVIKAHGLRDVSERIAFAGLEAALSLAGVKLDQGSEIPLPMEELPELNDRQIVDLLASLGIDAEKSRYGFPELQVHTTVPVIRKIVTAYLAIIKRQANSRPAQQSDEGAP